MDPYRQLPACSDLVRILQVCEHKQGANLLSLMACVPGGHGSGSKGRPTIELDEDHVQYLLSLGLSKSKGAERLGK